MEGIATAVSGEGVSKLLLEGGSGVGEGGFEWRMF